MNEFLQNIKTWIVSPFKGKYEYHATSEFSADDIKTILDARFYEDFTAAICEKIADDYVKLYRKDIYKCLDKKVIAKLALLKIAEKIKEEIVPKKVGK